MGSTYQAVIHFNMLFPVFGSTAARFEMLELMINILSRKRKGMRGFKFLYKISLYDV